MHLGVGRQLIVDDSRIIDVLYLELCCCIHMEGYPSGQRDQTVNLAA